MADDGVERDAGETACGSKCSDGPTGSVGSSEDCTKAAARVASRIRDLHFAGVGFAFRFWALAFVILCRFLFTHVARTSRNGEIPARCSAATRQNRRHQVVYF